MAEPEFKLGTPALVCRWRLADGCLPLENRHLRALAARSLGGGQITKPLVAWVKQRIEWGLDDASREQPDGVLMLVVDEAGASALTIGPYRPLGKTSANDLLVRAQASRREAEATGVAPEELWVAQGDALVCVTSSEFTPSGASSLIFDLARTMGMPVRRDEGLLYDFERRGFAGREVFLVSDEHGVVPAGDQGGRRAQKFAQSYRKLLTRNARRTI